MSTEGIIAIIALLGLLWFIQKKSDENRREEAQDRLRKELQGPNHHCMTCGNDQTIISGALRGNTAIEVILYLFYIVPGIIYSIWRRQKAAKKVCRACGGDALVPINSPAAIAHRKQLGTFEG